MLIVLFTGIDSLFDGPYKAWYAPELGASSHKNAKQLIEEIIETDGPFDGVIGFSQGAAVVATMMLERLEKDPFSPDLFRVAIFICGGCPLRVSLPDEDHGHGNANPNGNSNTCTPDPRGHWQRIDPQTVSPKQRIRIPTVHIVGNKDDAYEDSLRLRDVCNPTSRFEFDHGGGHEIPRDPRVTESMAKIIRKSIHKSFASF